MLLISSILILSVNGIPTYLGDIHRFVSTNHIFHSMVDLLDPVNCYSTKGRLVALVRLTASYCDPLRLDSSLETKLLGGLNWEPWAGFHDHDEFLLHLGMEYR